jgi:predicted house-cleaning noncanonical NTP pyrophosphatase (MazG superfamily)
VTIGVQSVEEEGRTGRIESAKREEEEERSQEQEQEQLQEQVAALTGAERGEGEADQDANGMAVDEEAAELVENGNMEQLAALVLSGEGYRIVGRHSSNPELQTFIDNVPIYMASFFYF